MIFKLFSVTLAATSAMPYDQAALAAGMAYSRCSRGDLSTRFASFMMLLSSNGLSFWFYEERGRLDCTRKQNWQQKGKISARVCAMPFHSFVWWPHDRLRYSALLISLNATRRLTALQCYRHLRLRRCCFRWRGDPSNSDDLAVLLERSGVDRAVAALGFSFLDLRCPPSNVSLHALHRSYEVIVFLHSLCFYPSLHGFQ